MARVLVVVVLAAGGVVVFAAGEVCALADGEGEVFGAANVATGAQQAKAAMHAVRIWNFFFMLICF